MSFLGSNDRNIIIVVTQSYKREQWFGHIIMKLKNNLHTFIHQHIQKMEFIIFQNIVSQQHLQNKWQALDIDIFSKNLTSLYKHTTHKFE